MSTARWLFPARPHLRLVATLGCVGAMQRALQRALRWTRNSVTYAKKHGGARVCVCVCVCVLFFSGGGNVRLQAAKAKYYGLNFYEVTRDEAEALHPLVDYDGVRVATAPV